MNVALILSGGTGTRLGAEIPKQYIKIGTRPVISYGLEQISAHEQIDAIQIVAEPAWQEYIAECLAGYDLKKKFRGFSQPGETRQLSVLNGIEDIRRYAQKNDYVMIHDAARPLLSAQLITACMEAVKGHDGVLPVLPMKDTIYQSENGRNISKLVNRTQFFAGQAPEVFLLEKYYQANIRLLPEAILQINGSAEPAVLAGMDIVMIAGDERNFKITTPSDLERFRMIAEASEQNR